MLSGLKIDLFLGFLKTYFIIWILLKNLNDNFRTFSQKFVITIFVEIIF